MSGSLANVGGVETMAIKAIEILQKDSILNKFKKNAKEIAAQFELNSIVGKYEELYNLALNKVNNEVV